MFFLNLILLLLLTEVTGTVNRASLTFDELRFTAVEKEDENLKDVGNMTICLGVRKSEDSSVDCSILEKTYVVDFSKEHKSRIETESVLPEEGAVLQFTFRVEKDNGQWTTHTFTSPHNVAGRPTKTLAENTYEYQFSASVRLECLNGYAAPSCLSTQELPPPVINTVEKATHVTEEYIDGNQDEDDSNQDIAAGMEQNVMTEQPADVKTVDEEFDSASFYRRRTISAYIASAIALILIALVVWKVVVPFLRNRNKNQNRCRDNENKLTEV